MSLASRLVSPAVLSLVALACGGTQPATTAHPGPGDSHDLDVSHPVASPADAGPVAAPVDAAPPAAPVTFVIKNSASEELALNLDRGWAPPTLQAYSGKPPHAKPITMFPNYCTAACAAPDEERCPLCKEPEKVADIKKAQKLEKVAPGGTLEVPWDAQVLAYEKCKGTRDGRSKKCECYKPAPVPPETYTVRACGLRLTSTADKSSTLVCAEGQMTLPGDGPIRVELDFSK